LPDWKPIALIVPAGLLLGIAVAQASRPVPLVKEERPWPQSVRENAHEIEPWRPLYEGRPQDLSPRGGSYRPDFDYDLFAWPDQTDRSAELLDAGYDYATAPEPDLPLTRAAAAEFDGEAAEVDAPEVPESGPDEPIATGETVVLPPVPPPLVVTNTPPRPVAPDDTGASSGSTLVGLGLGSGI
jgi:hypothetical protein